MQTFPLYTSQVYQWIAGVGLPIALLMLLLWAIWKIVVWLGERLLGKEDGLLTRLINRFLLFIERLEQNNSQQQQLLEQLARLQADPASHFSTLGTNRAIIFLAEALEQIANDRNVDISPQVAAIREALSRPTVPRREA